LKVVNELEYVGYKFKYKGTHYLVDTILHMYDKQNSMVDNLQSNIYPIIAKKYDKSIHNIKSSINKATECMYYECDARKLKDYFKFTDDTKPTVKQVVFTVINKISFLKDAS
ncbi:MAG: sporulation initiation factor Spo0A C-terminal domain-containing protein, partial [Clostridia bacterium]|nr:sporulation initiation factor Spo0A C-terminal domain-containing protein [Clostridia bacterium]